MSLNELLLAVMVLQQTLICGVWLIAARLQLARRPALWWAGSAALLSLSMGLILLRGRAPELLSLAGGNLVVIGAVVSLRIGVQGFVRRAVTRREHALVMGLAATGLFGVTVAGLGVLPVITIGGLAMAWSLGRTAQEIAQRLGPEFGHRAARWCALVPAVMALTFGLRAVLAPFAPQIGGSIVYGSVLNTAVVFVGLGLGLVLNMMLVALVVMRLVLRLRHQSDHDALTGLLGRRPLQDRLRQQAQSQAQRCALLSVDIDHFKQINDRHGHHVGDAVLVRVAHALQKASRAGDSVARTGGEEFCLLLPGASEAVARRVAQRLLHAVRALQHPEMGPQAHVTVSIGMALQGPDETPEDLLRRVDRALYAAKHAGRDRLLLAAPPAAAV